LKDPRQEKLADWRNGGYGATARRNWTDRRIMKDPTWKALVKALAEEGRALRKQGRTEEAKAHDAKYLADGILPPEQTFEMAVVKAGGRIVAASCAVVEANPADWAELDLP
jgi:hypothetical protein